MLVRVLGIFCLAFILCFTWYKIFMLGYEKYYVHRENRLQEIFNGRTKHDILFIGSSRTHTSVHPGIIDSITRLSSYNAGVEGGNLLEFLLTYKGYLENHPAPAYLVLNLDVNSVALERRFFNSSQYYPVLGNRVVDSILDANGVNTFLPKYLPLQRLIKYDEQTKSAAINGLRGKKEIFEGEFEFKGFLSNTVKCTDTTTRYPEETVIIDSEAIRYLEEIIALSKQKNVQLIFTYAPEYRGKLQESFSNYRECLEIYSKIAGANQIEFYRDDHLELCSEPCFFANYGHLNTPGAIEYSKILGKRLLSLIQKQ